VAGSALSALELFVPTQKTISRNILIDWPTPRAVGRRSVTTAANGLHVTGAKSVVSATGDGSIQEWIIA